MPFLDFALPRKRSLTAAIRSTTAFFKGFVRPMNAHLAPDWLESLSGEVVRSLGECDRVAYLSWAGGVLRQMAEFYADTPVEAAERRDFVARVADTGVLDNAINLSYLLPTYGYYQDARTVLEVLLSHLEEVTGEPLTRELAEANDGWSTAWELIDFLYDMARAEAEAVGLNLDAMIGPVDRRQEVIQWITGSASKTSN